MKIEVECDRGLLESQAISLKGPMDEPPENDSS